MGQMMQIEDSDVRKEMDRALAAVSQKIVPASQQQLAKVPEVIQQAIQMLQSMQPDPAGTVDPTAKLALEQKEASDARKDETARGAAQLKLVADEQKGARQDARQDRSDERKGQLEAASNELARELKFMELDSEKKSKAVEQAFKDAQQANQYAARLRELQRKEAGLDERLEAELESREGMNTSDNQMALTIAGMEVESGEKVAVETGTGVDPNP
jgi:hypothetical protein